MALQKTLPVLPPKHGVTYERLRKAIGRGYFHPGQRIVEREVARSLQVSRTPVREALFRLSEDGLVLEDRRGWRVPNVSPRDAADIFEIRSVLERLVAENAAERRDSDDIALLQACVRDAYHLIGEHRIYEFVEVIQRFHHALIRAGRNPYYQEYLRFAQGRTTLPLILVLREASNGLNVAREHDAILTAIVAKDGKRAAQLAEEHAFRSLERVTRGISVAKTYLAP